MATLEALCAKYHIFAVACHDLSQERWDSATRLMMQSSLGCIALEWAQRIENRRDSVAVTKRAVSPKSTNSQSSTTAPARETSSAATKRGHEAGPLPVSSSISDDFGSWAPGTVAVYIAVDQLCSRIADQAARVQQPLVKMVATSFFGTPSAGRFQLPKTPSGDRRNDSGHADDSVQALAAAAAIIEVQQRQIEAYRRALYSRADAACAVETSESATLNATNIATVPSDTAETASQHSTRSSATPAIFPRSATQRVTKKSGQPKAPNINENSDTQSHVPRAVVESALYQSEELEAAAFTIDATELIELLRDTIKALSSAAKSETRHRQALAASTRIATGALHAAAIARTAASWTVNSYSADSVNRHVDSLREHYEQLLADITAETTAACREATKSRRRYDALRRDLDASQKALVDAETRATKLSAALTDCATNAAFRSL
jgi:hypothetical protein